MLRAKTLDESYDILRACFSESEHARIDTWQARIGAIASDGTVSVNDAVTMGCGALEVAGEVRQWFLDMGVDSKDAKFRGRRGDQ